ncbi:MAG: 30S ribosomal protein S16, partial [Catenulispora sp.]|nr:30S ribosomal protein S16 [Catenulispora sp.]
AGATTPKKKAEKAEKKADETPATEAPVETPAPAVEAEISSEG